MDIPRAKYKIQNISTHMAFKEALNKKLTKQLFKRMGVLNLQELEKISANWVKILNTIASKTIKSKSPMGDTKPKDASKPDIVKLEKTETYCKGIMLPEGGYIDIHISSVNSMEIEETSC